jgi:ABC-2 type transport system permease protein
MMLAQAWLIFRQQMRLSFREPIWYVIGLIQPLIYLGLFAPLLKPLAGGPGFPPGSALEVFVPGLLVQMGMFGTLFVGFALMADMRAGVIERLRVSPASRMALLLGRVGKDVLMLTAQSAILLTVATAMGLRASPSAWLLLMGLVGLLGISLASLSYAAALTLKSEDALAQLLNTLSVPAMLLSGILLPMTLAPKWLRGLTKANPFSYVVDAARAAMGSPAAAATLWLGIGVALGLAVVGLWVGKRTFERESA